MKNCRYTICIIFLLVFSGCEEEWLEVRRDKKQVIPHTLEDFQALLDNISVMNQWATPSLGEAGSDDYYVMTEDWENLTSTGALQQKNAYIWAEEIFDTENSGNSWNAPYQMVYYSNVALEGLEGLNIPQAREVEANNIHGSALFYRSWAFYQLAQLFCNPYDAITAGSDAGIALRLESDINVPSVRATVEETYNRIIIDLEKAVELLPDLPEVKIRPSKASGYALLGRVYLQMGDYEKALAAANKSLEIYDVLMDYNALDANENYPIAQFNEETLFYSTMESIGSGILIESKLIVVPELYAMYEDADLRKTIFYYDDEGLIRYKGSYSNAEFFGMYMFSGLATDEVYLIKAESHARLGETADAAETLNILLEKRYAEFEPIAESGILEKVITERRKELVFRGIRWSDLRRLNKEPQFAKTLSREVGGATYSLAPEDKRYTLPVPPLVISLTGMNQNER